MNVIEINASFVTTLIACMAVIACVLVGVFYGVESRKKLENLRRRKDIQIKSLQEMSEYKARKAESKGYDSGFELGYQQALADIKTGKIDIKEVKNNETHK